MPDLPFARLKSAPVACQNTLPVPLPSRDAHGLRTLAGLLARESTSGERLPMTVRHSGELLSLVLPHSGGAAPESHRVPFSHAPEGA